MNNVGCSCTFFYVLSRVLSIIKSDSSIERDLYMTNFVISDTITSEDACGG